MKRAAKAGIVVAGVVAVGLAGAITLNATQAGSHSIEGSTTPATASATPSASAAGNVPSATPGAATSTPAANASPGAAPSSQAPAPAPTASSKPEAPAAPVPAPAAPAPAAPAPAAPAPGAQGLDGAGIQRIEDICTARLQSDAAHSGTVTGTVVPRPFIVVSIAFSGTPVRATGASGLPAYDVLMKTTIKLADSPAQDGQRVCRVYDAEAHVVDWLPAG